MLSAQAPCIYRLKVVLRGISPMIWRRLLLRSLAQAQFSRRPQSMINSVPVMLLESSESRNLADRATSSDVPSRFKSDLATIVSSNSFRKTASISSVTEHCLCPCRQSKSRVAAEPEDCNDSPTARPIGPIDVPTTHRSTHRPTYRPSRGEQFRSSASSEEPYVFRLASSWNIASPLSAFDCGKYSCTLIASFSTSR
jgi:hypothetical protein